MCNQNSCFGGCGCWLIIAIIIGIDKFDLLGLGGAQPQLSAEGDEDDDF